MSTKPLPFTPSSLSPVKAEEAASLVLLRGTKENLEVLLGKRRDDLRFMPGYAVFPGGRVDTQDRIIAKRMAKSEGRNAYTLSGVRDTLSGIDWLAHSLAACRECLEETGLLIHLLEQSQLTEDHSYLKACESANLSSIKLPLPCIAQAITPESSSIRFNARFFYASNANLNYFSPAEGELHSIGWYDAKEALESFALADVTEFVLKEAIKCFREERKPSIPPLLTYDHHSEAVIIDRVADF